MVTIDHTTPFTWTVGSASALTVSGLVAEGGVGCVSAHAAGASRPRTPPTRSMINAPATVLMDAADDNRNIPGFPRSTSGKALDFVTPATNTKRDDHRRGRG